MRKPAPVLLLGSYPSREKAEAAVAIALEKLGPDAGPRLSIDGRAPRFRVLLADAEPQARCDEIKARGVTCSFLYPAGDGSLR